MLITHVTLSGDVLSLSLSFPIWILRVVVGQWGWAHGRETSTSDQVEAWVGGRSGDQGVHSQVQDCYTHSSPCLLWRPNKASYNSSIILGTDKCRKRGNESCPKGEGTMGKIGDKSWVGHQFLKPSACHQRGDAILCGHREGPQVRTRRERSGSRWRSETLVTLPVFLYMNWEISVHCSEPMLSSEHPPLCGLKQTKSSIVSQECLSRVCMWSSHWTVPEEQNPGQTLSLREWSPRGRGSCQSPSLNNLTPRTVLVTTYGRSGVWGASLPTRMHSRVILIMISSATDSNLLMMGTVMCNRVESVGKYESNLRLIMLQYLEHKRRSQFLAQKNMDSFLKEPNELELWEMKTPIEGAR